MWHFLFSQCHPVTIVLDIDVVEILENSGGPPSSLRWGFLVQSKICKRWGCDSKCHSSHAHRLCEQSCFGFPLVQNILWRQPWKNVSACASLATIFALKPLGHERLRVLLHGYLCAIRMPKDLAFCQSFYHIQQLMQLGATGRVINWNPNELCLTASKNRPHPNSSWASQVPGRQFLLHSEACATLPRKCQTGTMCMGGATGTWDGWAPLETGVAPYGI